jgi:hypothetical protein
MAVKMYVIRAEVASTSEASVSFYQTTRRNNPEDSHLRTRRRENLKSCNIFLVQISTMLNLTGVTSSFVASPCLYLLT